MDNPKFGEVQIDLLPGMIEKNLHDFYAYLAQHTTCSQPTQYGISWMRPENSTWPNLIYSAGLNEESLDADLLQIIAGIEEKVIPPVWLVGPLARPLGLSEVLLASKFLPVMRWSGMALALDVWQEPLAGLEDFTIEVVNSVEVLEEWLYVVQAGLLRNSQIDVRYFAKLLQREEVRFYLGRVAGKPVGTSLLYLSADEHQQIAGLYLIAVIPDYRGQGIGRLLTARPVRDAQQRGCSFAVLQATQLGEGVYSRLGFQEFCEFVIYKYQS